MNTVPDFLSRSRLARWLVLLSPLLLGLGWTLAAGGAQAESRSEKLSAVRTWAIQLGGLGGADGPRLAPLKRAPFGLLVIEPNDDDGQPWSRAEVEAAAQDKLLVAYLSVGAAEDYRRYWQPGWKPGQPEWILKADPDWPGNYDVAYWNPAWQKLALAGLDTLIDQGFHGVYLDLIDAYMRRPERPTARAEMVRWVCKIAAHAHARDPQFLIIPQNAPELLLDPGYAACVDAAAQEETFVYATDGVTEPERQTELLGSFKAWRKLGKPVLTLDYASNPGLISQTYSRARAAGLVPYVSVRNLDVLTPGR
ncbi:MJ1477/TM1410 family putative glycoside hydrolase [Deinococcus marmoris]|uniref:MJ1477/TM1410 family putative glycoside hydrolase n=1 Tax=Deinococcus marmoris TaxID=249408 RepID=UPI0009F8519B|nr:MJ1477/TM1410 family putative glycoside hydrolase [Deinococcus marmoris]